MAIENCFVTDLLALSVTRTVKSGDFLLLALVGVPLITPVELSRVRPSGSAPAMTLAVYGPTPPLICKFALKLNPTSPFGKLLAPTTSGGGETAVACLTVLLVELKSLSLAATEALFAAWPMAVVAATIVIVAVP